MKNAIARATLVLLLLATISTPCLSAERLTDFAMSGVFAQGLPEDEEQEMPGTDSPDPATQLAIQPVRILQDLGAAILPTRYDAFFIEGLRFGEEARSITLTGNRLELPLPAEIDRLAMTDVRIGHHPGIVGDGELLESRFVGENRIQMMFAY